MKKFVLMLALALSVVACNGAGGGSSSSGKPDNFELTGTVEQ